MAATRLQVAVDGLMMVGLLFIALEAARVFTRRPPETEAQAVEQAIPIGTVAALLIASGGIIRGRGAPPARG